ncbi:MAG: MBL fold metallo-hydrolase [Candidatus Hodarchaeota archaeon]
MNFRTDKKISLILECGNRRTNTLKNNPIRFILPTPYSVGSVNVYFIPDTTFPTLIDIGIGSLGLEKLKSELNAVGYELKDIARCVLSHGHSDHTGLIEHISASSDVFIHPADLQTIQKITIDDLNQSLSALKDFLISAGLAIKYISAIKNEIRDFYLKYMIDVPDAQTVTEGFIFTFDTFNLEVIETPGHTPGCISLLDRENKILFSGDHILPKITPNPLIQILNPDPNYKSLLAYRDSLQKIRELNPRIVYPGHGDPITQPQKVIQQILEHHEKRKNILLNWLKSKEYTMLELSHKLFGELAGFGTILGLSEIKGHLEYLESLNLIKHSDTLPNRYSAFV